ncbi:Ctr copper transporter family-domain-containing protein [Zopfochytrium polystomum]|nr:Ctr copper transporter family-domain-containing protein [Zopfochytrium polystomum]
MPRANASAAATALCDMMDWMPGCTVRRLCGGNGDGENDEDDNKRREPFCEPFAVLADVCARDMPRMRGCTAYNNVREKAPPWLCRPGTAVKQCSAVAPLPHLPTTREAQELVGSICGEMDMPGCERCRTASAALSYGVGGASSRATGKAAAVVKPCDAFAVYAQLCAVMPGMEQVNYLNGSEPPNTPKPSTTEPHPPQLNQCSTFRALCAATPRFPLCPGAPTDDDNSDLPPPPPAMKMFFHGGTREYFLLESWVPASRGQFAAACVAVAVAAVAYEWMLAAAASGRARRGRRGRKGFGRRRVVPASAAGVVWARAARAWADWRPRPAAASAEAADVPLLGGAPASAAAKDGLNGGRGGLAGARVFTRRRLARAAYRAAFVALSYALMLLVMTYNVWVCGAAVVGMGVGDFMFAAGGGAGEEEVGGEGNEVVVVGDEDDDDDGGEEAEGMAECCG